jgi:hypothetical protein
MPPKQQAKRQARKRQVVKIDDKVVKAMDSDGEEEVGPVTIENFDGYQEQKQVGEIDEDSAENNKLMVEGEIEGVASCLIEQEYEIVTDAALFPEGAQDGEKFSHMVKLSLIPSTEMKFVIHDRSKEILSNLRCPPPLKLDILIPHTYPSNSRPLLLLKHG